MGHIEYTTTKFVKPQPLGENEYIRLKQEIDKNSNYEIATEGESFTEHFARYFKLIGIGFGGGFLLSTIGVALFDGSKWLALFMLPGSLLFFIGFILIIKFFFEAPSFAKYKIQKRNYYGNMKIAIQETDSYDEFFDAFYI